MVTPARYLKREKSARSLACLYLLTVDVYLPALIVGNRGEDGLIIGESRHRAADIMILELGYYKLFLSDTVDYFSQKIGIDVVYKAIVGLCIELLIAVIDSNVDRVLSVLSEA